MRFSYTYKTSDGRRHEDRIEAPTREEAFALLRERGVRPIKVVSLSGSKANGEERVVTRKRVVFAALAVGLAAGMGLTAWSLAADHRDRRLIALEAEAQGIVERHRAAIRTLNLDELRDYARIAAADRPGLLNQKILLCYHDLNDARGEVRACFRKTFLGGREEAKLKDGARLVFEAAMDELDLIESHVVKAEKAYRLLDAHRGAWRLENGRPKFSDAKLEAAFANLNREVMEP